MLGDCLGKARQRSGSTRQQNMIDFVMWCAGKEKLQGTANFLHHVLYEGFEYSGFVIVGQFTAAFFGFGLLLVPALALTPLTFTELWPLLIVLTIEWWSDARASAMLGDTGSNLLGALAGVFLVQSLPLMGQTVLLVVLLALNLASERLSISATIEKTRWLKWLDHKLGAR